MSAFASAVKGKIGEDRITIIFMSWVLSLVPFGLFQCFSGFLTVKLDRKVLDAVKMAKTTQYPKAKYVVADLLGELLKRGVEVRFVDNLWQIAGAVKTSSLNWSLCRMANALPRN